MLKKTRMAGALNSVSGQLSQAEIAVRRCIKMINIAVDANPLDGRRRIVLGHLNVSLEGMRKAHELIIENHDAHLPV